MPPLSIALVGDYDAGVVAHQAIPRAIELASSAAGVAAVPRWCGTPDIGPDGVLGDEVAGVWCVPASPYANTAGALAAIRWARETGRPFLGTCGGFQHALLDVARHVWHMTSAAHAELDPGASDPIVAPLVCSLVEASGRVHLVSGSWMAEAYGLPEIVETYHCRYGLNPRYASRLDGGPLRAVAWDDEGDVRGVELDGHPFFVATLFQPERAALGGHAPALVCAFLRAAAAAREASREGSPLVER